MAEQWTPEPEAGRLLPAGAPVEWTDTVGRCGYRAPVVFPGTPSHVFCRLPAGHAGWHKADDGRQWTPAAEPESAIEARVRAQVAAETAALRHMIEWAIRSADWEPGDAQRALWKLRDDYARLEPSGSPVETLRAAAEKLRTLAGKATPGPWYASDTNIGVKTSDHRMLAPFAETLLDDTDTRDNHPTASATAEWIATLHPGVADPLADCFEQIARMVRLDADFISRVALAAARTILGEGDADRPDRAEEPTDA